MSINKNEVLCDYFTKNHSVAKNIIRDRMFKFNITEGDGTSVEDLFSSFIEHMLLNFNPKDEEKIEAYLNQSLRNFVKSELRKNIRYRTNIRDGMNNYLLCESHAQNAKVVRSNSMYQNSMEEDNQISCLSLRRAIKSFFLSLKNPQHRKLAHLFFEEDLTIKKVSELTGLSFTYTHALKKKLACRAQQFLLNEGISPSNLSN